MAFSNPQPGADELLRSAQTHFGDIELCAEGRVLFRERLEALQLGESQRSRRALDLYLAIAAGSGQPEAIALVDDEIRRLLPAARQLGLSDADLDDVAQVVRLRLFSPASTASGIRAYAGRGALGAWLRAAIIKTGLRHRETQRARELAGSAEDDLVSSLIPERPADVQLDKHETMAVVRRVLYQSLGELDGDSRRLLRAHVLDGATMDMLAEQEQVHRATVARRVTKACNLLRRAVLRHLARANTHGKSDAVALVSWVESQLDLSLSRLLPKSPAGSKKTATDRSAS